MEGGVKGKLRVSSIHDRSCNRPSSTLQGSQRSPHAWMGFRYGALTLQASAVRQQGAAVGGKGQEGAYQQPEGQAQASTD
jgi:hypothetical protein